MAFVLHAQTTEILLLPNGEILVHNLTPTIAALLSELDPADPSMRLRAAASGSPKPSRPLPNRPDRTKSES